MMVQPLTVIEEGSLSEGYAYSVCNSKCKSYIRTVRAYPRVGSGTMRLFFSNNICSSNPGCIIKFSNKSHSRSSVRSL